MGQPRSGERVSVSAGVHRKDLYMEWPPNTAEAEMEAAFACGEIVVACRAEGCPMHRLEPWAPGLWIYWPRAEAYASYRYARCPVHHRGQRDKGDWTESRDAAFSSLK